MGRPKLLRYKYKEVEIRRCKVCGEEYQEKKDSSNEFVCTAHKRFAYQWREFEWKRVPR